MDDEESFMNVETYLGMMRKYPEAREDLLNLRRQKNTATVFLICVAFSLGAGIVWILK